MRHTISCVLLGIAVSVATTGCIIKTDSSKTDDKPKGGHNHPTKGLHGGPLVELGNEEYHGEVIMNEETDTLTIYILDDRVEKAVPIEAKTVVVTYKHGRDSDKRELPAKRDKDDPKGKSSRFELVDNDLVHALSHGEEAEAKLIVVIGGKSYTGDITLKPHTHSDGTKH